MPSETTTEPDLQVLGCAHCHKAPSEHPHAGCLTYCRCGSGAHPRRCPTHPERFDEHCNELDDEEEGEK